jgi:hypothetical protein
VQAKIAAIRAQTEAETGARRKADEDHARELGEQVSYARPARLGAEGRGPPTGRGRATLSTDYATRHRQNVLDVGHS